MLNNFYPFKGEDYEAKGVEAKIVIRKGKIKLYEAVLPGYDFNLARIAEFHSKQASGIPSNNTLYRPSDQEYKTYILKDSNGELFGVKNPFGANKLRLNGHEDFLKSIETVFGDDEELMSRFNNKELKYKDLPEVVRLYNLKH